MPDVSKGAATTMEDLIASSDWHLEEARRVRAEAIPLQTRMMTISDIYDALTAQDRPYKPAIPAARALDILGEEVKRGQVDGELLRVFVEAKVWE